MAPVPLMAAPRRLSLAAPLDGGKEDDPEASPVAQAPTGPRTTELVAQVSVPKMDVPQPPASGSSGTTRTVVVGGKDSEDDAVAKVASWHGRTCVAVCVCVCVRLCVCVCGCVAVCVCVAVAVCYVVVSCGHVGVLECA